jgi:hypothetical protein
MWWFLTREVLRLRGEINRQAPWDVMPDLFFYRDPEEVREYIEKTQWMSTRVIPSVDIFFSYLSRQRRKINSLLLTKKMMDNNTYRILTITMMINRWCLRPRISQVIKRIGVHQPLMAGLVILLAPLLLPPMIGLHLIQQQIRLRMQMAGDFLSMLVSL